MLGTVVNTSAIVVGSVLGRTALKHLPGQWHRTALQAVGLAVVFIGITTAFDAFRARTVLLAISLVLGGLVGEALGLHNRMQALEQWAKRTFGAAGSDLARGFVTASLIFVVGPMAILGSLQDGLGGVPSILYAKATLDGLTSVALAATLGLGVMGAALPVFAVQGAISLFAGWLAPLFTQSVVAAISGVGGLLISGIGLNMLGTTNIRVASLLPAVVIAPMGVWLVSLWGGGS